jgi:hypothetical protein
MLHQIQYRISNADRFKVIRPSMYFREIKYISTRLNEPLFGAQVIDNRLKVSSCAKHEVQKRSK